MTSERYLTPEEARLMLGVCRKTMYRWLNSKKVKGVRIGGSWRIRESDMPKPESAVEVKPAVRQRREPWDAQYR
jgi:excisionase family DNA binding protein